MSGTGRSGQASGSRVAALGSQLIGGVPENGRMTLNHVLLTVDGSDESVGTVGWGQSERRAYAIAYITYVRARSEAPLG
jgi:hypothetical protein